MSLEGLMLRTAVERAADLAHEVPARKVAPLLVHTAEMVAAKAATRLGIPTPRVRWLPAETRGVWGATYPARLGEVWITIRKDRASVIETVAHEVRHVWQLTDFHWLGLGLDSMAAREEDAVSFGREMRRRMTGE